MYDRNQTCACASGGSSSCLITKAGKLKILHSHKASSSMCMQPDSWTSCTSFPARGNAHAWRLIQGIIQFIHKKSATCIGLRMKWQLKMCKQLIAYAHLPSCGQEEEGEKRLFRLLLQIVMMPSPPPRSLDPLGVQAKGGKLVLMQWPELLPRTRGCLVQLGAICSHCGPFLLRLNNILTIYHIKTVIASSNSAIARLA